MRKVGDAREFEVKVAAVCLDADVALLSCKSEEFWEGLEAVDIQSQLPQLQVSVIVIVCAYARAFCMKCCVWMHNKKPL